MVPTECPVCHKKPALAGNTAYCPHCGWNRASAISSLKMSLNSMPIGIVMFGAMAAYLYWGMGFKRAPQLMTFFAFPALVIPLNYFLMKRKLAALNALCVAPQDASAPPDFGLVPSNAPVASSMASSNFDRTIGAANDAAPFPPSPEQTELLRTPAPRQIRTLRRGRITLWVAALGLLAFTAAMGASLYKQWTLHHSFAGVRGLGWAIAIEVIVALAAFGIWRSQTRECDLLEHGETVMGRVTRQWFDDKRNSRIEYEFADFLGSSHRGSANDLTSKLFAGMPVVVFYDRDNPKRQIAYCSTLHEVVLPFAPIAAPAASSAEELLAKR